MIGKNLCFIIINEVLPTFKDKFYAGIQKGLGCQRSWEFLLKPYILVIKVYFFSNAKMSFEIISKWIGNSSWKNITRWHRDFLTQPFFNAILQSHKIRDFSIRLSTDCSGFYTNNKCSWLQSIEQSSPSKSVQYLTEYVKPYVGRLAPERPFI